MALSQGEIIEGLVAGKIEVKWLVNRVGNCQNVGDLGWNMAVYRRQEGGKVAVKWRIEQLARPCISGCSLDFSSIPPSY